MGQKSNRRDFLKGRAAADSLADSLAGGILPSVKQHGSKAMPAESPIVHVARKAMACDFELQFPDDPAKNLTELALESFNLLETLEERLSFFRPTSEIGRINLLAAERPVEVEPELFDLLLRAKRLSEETGGAWDITSTPLWQIWGFAKRKGKIPAKEEIDEALSRVGFRFVELDAERKTVHFTRPGVKLNLGSLGKGYALDCLAARLLEGGMTNFLLHGGQSSILQKKGPAQSIPRKDIDYTDASREKDLPPPVFWPIGLPHPFQPNRRLGEIKLFDRALGTSNSRFQSFRHEGKLFGHILDPRTGFPAEGVLSTTVLAPTATMADALSTAFYVMGADKSLEFCDRHPEIAVILLIPSSGKSDCEILTAGLADGEFSIF
jgi:thiamine biosynthesis lipoprotein